MNRDQPGRWGLASGSHRDSRATLREALTGEETLELAGRTIPAVWFDTRTKGDGGLDVLTRTWMADNVPGRLVKSVTRIPKAKTVVTVELTDWSRPGQRP